MKSLVLDSVSSPITKRVYNMALDEFFAWYAQEPRPGFTKATVSAWRVTLEERGLGSSSIIVRMSAIRKLAVEATDNGLLAPELAAGIAREEREVNRRQVRQVAHTPASPGAPERAGYHHQGLRDRASIAGLLGCGPKARSPMGHSKACFRSPQNGRLVYTDPQAGNQMSDMPANEPSRGTPCGLQFYSQPSE